MSLDLRPPFAPDESIRWTWTWTEARRLRPGRRGGFPCRPDHTPRPVPAVAVLKNLVFATGEPPEELVELGVRQRDVRRAERRHHLDPRRE